MKKFQNGFEVYRPMLSNISHAKRNTGRHSLDDYHDLGEAAEE